MSTEEQTQFNGFYTLKTGTEGDERTNLGQRLFILNRVLTQLSFMLKKVGTDTSGSMIARVRIRRVSDDELLREHLFSWENYTPSEEAWRTFDITPILLNEEVRIYVWCTWGVTQGKLMGARQSYEDVKPGEYLTEKQNDGNDDDPWVDREGWDCAYKYTYSALATATTQAVSDIRKITATGNGNVTDLGDGSVTAHGHCWNTTGTPTTADDKKDNGAKGETGAYTSAMTELAPETLYYVRAFVTTEYGTSYGNEVEFTTLSPDTPSLGKTKGFDFRGKGLRE